MTETNVVQPKNEVTPASNPTPPAAATNTAVTTETKAVAKVEVVSEAEATSSKPLHPEVKPHAFVVMPFGKKKGADGHPYDFNAIYFNLIKPALIEAGFEPFRADEETSAGDILTDMFQELLLADLVIADLSIDNANAFYELGIRHAFRKRGVVHIQAGRAYMPFDIFNVRTLPYHITPEGEPDPAFLRTDINAIARMVRDTWASDRDAIHSPIFNLLTGLHEPDRKSLHTPLATGFWREYNEWRERVTVAQRQKHIGDILLLTEEISNPLIREEAIGEVGRALANLGRNELALTQYRKGLEVNAGNIDFRREEAFHLNRLGRVDEAIVKVENLLKDFPNDGKAITYLGRIYKEMWTSSWMKIKDPTKRIQMAFDSYHWLIKAIDIYLKGFRLDLNDYYPGINALTLSTMVIHLADKLGNKKSPDPDITRIRNLMPTLKSTIHFGLESKVASEGDNIDYWTLISMAELKLLTSDDFDDVARAYRKAITASRRNYFFLASSLAQLEIFKAIDMRTEFAQASIDLISEEILRVSGEDPRSSKPTKKSAESQKATGRSFLFTGLMVDQPGKQKKAFPSEKESEIRSEIRKKIEKFKPTADDRAYLAGLSAGSEIIFAELCIEMGLKLKVYFSKPESAYIREFVSYAGEAWVDRFYKIRNHPDVTEIYQFEAVGLPKDDDDPYERNIRWAVYSALGRVGMANVRLIAVANETTNVTEGEQSLSRYMIDLVRSMGGIVESINPSKYIYSVIDNALERMILDSEPKMPPRSLLRKRKK